MSKGVVTVKFLEKIDRQLCGDEDYRRDAPWCDQKDRQSVNLADYSKLWDYVIFCTTPTQVEFCRDYDEFYSKYDHTQSCTDTPFELKQRLRGIIEGHGQTFDVPVAMAEPSYKPVVEETPSIHKELWYEHPATEGPRDASDEPKPSPESRQSSDQLPSIPSIGEIYAILSNGVPPASRKTYRKVFLEKAQKIRQQMVEIDRLLAEKSPEADDKILALYQEIEDICDEPSATVLRQIDHDCQGILNQNKDVNAVWHRIIGTIGGVIGTILALFFKSGKGGKSWKAMKKAWRENKGQGFFTRILSVFDAFNQARKGMDVEQPYPPAEIEPAPIPGMDEFDPLEGLPGPEETPPAEEVSRLREGYRFKSDMEDSALLQNFKATIQSFINVTTLPFITEAVKERTARFAEVMAYASNLDNRSTISNIAPIFHEETTLKAFEQLIDSYTQWLVKDRLSQVAREAGEAYEAIKRHSQQAVKETIKKKIETLKKISETIYNSIYTMGSLRLHLRKSIEGIHETMIISNKTLVERWRTTIADIDGLIHDMEQIYPPLAAYIPKSEGDPKLEEQLERLSHYDLDRLDVSLGFVNRLNRSLAGKHGVELELGEAPKLIIPEPMRFDLFRIVNELANNAIKYADPSKKERYVRINTEVVEEQGRVLLRIIIADNGVGMDPEDISRAFRGVRLRPDLAEGQGQGLPTIKNLADKHETEVAIESVLGVHTKVTIEKDISNWEKPPPTGNGGPAASGASPSSTTPSTGSAPSTPSAHGMMGVRRFADVGGFAPQDKKMFSSPENDGAAVWIYTTAGQSGVNTMGQGVAPQWWFPSVGPASAVWFGAAQMAGARALTVAP